MKKTQLKDAIRNIRKQKVSYISIILISFLAVTCYLGVSFASRALAMGGTALYEAQNFRDIEAVSVLLFDSSDIEKIASLEGVKDVEGQLRTTAKVLAGDKNPEVTVLSMTERVNIPVLVEGAFPADPSECVVEKDLASDLGLKLGDTITLDETGSALRILSDKTYKVTGVIHHPDNLVTPNPLKNYVMVKTESFDMETLQGRYVYAEIVVDKPAGINRFDREYFDLLAPVEERLEELSIICAEKTLTDMWKRFAEYKKLLSSDILKSVFAAGIADNKGISLEEAEKLLKESGWLSGDEELDLKNGAIDIGAIKIFNDFSLNIPKKSELASAVPDLMKRLVDEINKRGFELPYKVDTERLETLISDFLDKVDISFYDKIESAVALWNNGHQRYLVSLANQSLAEGEEKGVGVWIAVNAKMNAGYMHLALSSDGMSSLSLRFTMLFIIVAAIVIYATVGKIVDEQKKLVGTTKAFGFYKREVFGKYLAFGCSATLVGCLLGILAGTFLLQFFAVYSYGRFYFFGTPALTVIPWQLVAVPVAGVLLAAAAVWFACGRLLRSPATELMKDAIPAGKKKTKRSNRRGMSLYNKLIIRNMRTDLKRICVTIVSIAGCCALILIGFSLNFSVRNTIDIQFEEIVLFDSYVKLDTGSDADAVNEVGAALDGMKLSHISAYTESGAFRVKNGTEPADFLVADPGALGDYFMMYDRDNGDLLASSDDGIMLPASYADVYGLRAGDTCMLIDSTGAAYKVKISGLFENHLGKTVIISPKYFETVFCKSYEPNTLLVKHPDTEREAIAEKLSSVSGYADISRSDPLRVMFRSFSDLLVLVVFILVGAAAAMSAVILTNLVNICILQKKRELTVMRVNGFTTKEVKNYVSREALITTAAGVVLGTVVGLLQIKQILPAMGKTYTQFITTPNVLAIAIAAAITALFTVVIYRITLRKVKDLKLTDIA